MKSNFLLKKFSLASVAVAFVFVVACAVPDDAPAPENFPSGKICSEKSAPAQTPADIALAHQIRAEAPWDVPDDIFRNYVLPQTSIGENADDWRPLFREKFRPLVRDCKTPTDAAEKLNREIWDALGVHYSPQRDKPDQSPFHSMRIGKASCTGLSILLIDACRAVGVPARFVGCRWKYKPGNHSWVEIWDAGEWKHLGAGDGGSAGNAWFDADAACADPDDSRFAIYAACVDSTGEFFPLLWCGSDAPSSIPALNVTARYLALAKKTPADCARVAFVLKNRRGERVAKTLVIFDAATGAEFAVGKTRDDRFDLNDHLTFALPRGKKWRIGVRDDTGAFFPLGEIVAPESGEKLFQWTFPAE